MSWLDWLGNVAGVRWYPPLASSGTSELHSVIAIVRDQYPQKFVPMLQYHWAAEYAAVYRSNGLLKSALRKSEVLCWDESKAQLESMWFPSKDVVAWVRYLNIDYDLPIIALPNIGSGLEINDWSCLSELGPNPQVGLAFFKHALLAMANKADHIPDLSRITELYQHMGESSTLSDQVDMKVCVSDIRLTSTDVSRHCSQKSN